MDLEYFIGRSERIPFAGCWIWQKGLFANGYGMYWDSVSKKPKFAHRGIWESCNGAIPEGMEICHHCDTPCCINPYHLFLGRHLDNFKDAARKGRMRRGHNHHLAKLALNEVIEIKQLLARGHKQKDIAATFNVHVSTISHIKKGLVWAWVTLS
jgi:hypothetical protein